MLLKVLNLFSSENKNSDIHIREGIGIYYRTAETMKKLEISETCTQDEIKNLLKDILKIRYKENTEDIFNNFIKTRKELDFSIEYTDTTLNFRARINAFYFTGKIGIVMRKIPVIIPELGSLGLETIHIQEIIKQSGVKEGLILITGQTGSGKSTTLAAIINEINKTKEKHIVTIEDPVEFFHTSKKSLITHREIGEYSDTKDFTTGLRASLREDPDIILIGELRDKETAEAALQASQTGHIVFATLHTNSAAESVQRMIDLFPIENEKNIKKLLSNTIRLIMSQRLISQPGKKMLAYEILTNSIGMKNTISSDDKNIITNIKNEMFRSQKPEQGSMQLLNTGLCKLVANGKITKEIAMEYSNDTKELDSMLGDKSIMAQFKSAIDLD